MWRLQTVGKGWVGVAIVGCVACGPGGQAGAPAVQLIGGTGNNRTISIGYNCSANNVDVSYPDAAHVQVGGNVEWRLIPPGVGRPQDVIRITPKDTSQWVFPAAQVPHAGRRDAPATGTNAQGQTGVPYGYSIYVQCTRGQRTQTVTVDPDLILDDAEARRDTSANPE